MLMYLLGEVLHCLRLSFGCDTESVVRLGPVLVPQLRKIVGEDIVVEPNLSAPLVESSVTTEDLGPGHRAVVNKSELDGPLDCDER